MRGPTVPAKTQHSDTLEPRLAPRQQRRTATDIVYDALYQAIVEMELEPGAAIQEKLLAERFAVSRTPVREALLHLAREGLVEIIPQSGTTISRIPIGAIGEAMVIRRALEAVTVTRAAELATPADVVRLDAIIAQQRLADKLGDQNGFHVNDEAFHEFIAAIGKFATIWKLIRQSKVQIDRVRRMTLPVKGRMTRVIREHIKIRDAIAAGTPLEAVAALDAHLEILVPDVNHLCATHPDYFIGTPQDAFPVKFTDR